LVLQIIDENRLKSNPNKKGQYPMSIVPLLVFLSKSMLDITLDFSVNIQA